MTLKRVALTVLKCSLTTVAVGGPVGVVGVLKGVTYLLHRVPTTPAISEEPG